MTSLILVSLTASLVLGQPATKPATAPPPAPPAGQPATTQPASKQPSSGRAPGVMPLNIQPAEPAAPKPVPVPSGEVVKKTELEGGLIVEDLKIGDGYEIKPGGAVVAFYHGTLKDGGKIFDSAFDRGEPAAFPLNGVIEGWQKGVPGMKIGGVRRLTIPAKLGYGERGMGQNIPPNADLVFVIQIVDALQITDTKEGEGEGAAGSFVAVTAYSMKDAEGKEVEKADAAHPYIWIPGECQGVQYGLEGMKPGGKRTIKIPKEMNTATPLSPAGRPAAAPITVEIELIALRNLPKGGRR